MAKNQEGPGRPTVMNKRVQEKILEMIVDGWSITKIAIKLGFSRQVIYNFRTNPENGEFADKVAIALKLRAEIIADETIEIADDESKDLLTDPDTGKQYSNNAAVARAKVRIATRQKLLQYYDPAKYGDKSSFDLTSNGETILFGGLMITPPKDEDDYEEE